MLQSICPKLPMRNIAATKVFYIQQLGFTEIADYGNYLIVEKDKIEIHFFEFKDLNIKSNYGQVYIRVQGIEAYYNELLRLKISIHPNAPLKPQPWGQLEFSLLDSDNNLLTFGEEI
jgi:hypothetical protein